MKKILFLIPLFFFGCVTDPIYNKAKSIYIDKREVVIENWDKLPDNVKEKLKALDTTLKTYDKIRSRIEESLSKKKDAKLNLTKSSVGSKKDNK